MGAISFFVKKQKNEIIPGFMFEEKSYGVVKPAITWNVVKQ